MEFDRLMADFGNATGIDADADSQGTVWLESDGVQVTVQHLYDRDCVVIYTLPFGEMAADETMMRRALELSSAGLGTDGFFVGLCGDSLTLSVALPLEGLDAESLGRRLLALSAVTRRVERQISSTVVDECVDRFEAEENSETVCNQFAFRV